MQNQHYVLMADIIDSSQQDGNKLMSGFKDIVLSSNQQLTSHFLSPATITLGDEFQAITKDLPSSLEIIFYMEEELVKKEYDFQLRYVLHYGTIDTKINSEIAYEMLGEGLTRARKTLNELKDRSKRFIIDVLPKNLSDTLNESLTIYDHLKSQWKKEDYILVKTFWKHNDYKKVAEILGKDVSLMWRREKSLNLKEYDAIKSVIKYLATEK